MNHIQISFCDEDRARLDAIIARLDSILARPEGQKPDCQTCVDQIKEAAAKTFPAAEAEHPADVSTAPWESPAAQPPSFESQPRPVSLAEFQKAVASRCADSPEIKKAVIALAELYTEERPVRLSAIPEEMRAEFLDKMAQI